MLKARAWRGPPKMFPQSEYWPPMVGAAYHCPPQNRQKKAPARENSAVDKKTATRCSDKLMISCADAVDHIKWGALNDLACWCINAIQKEFLGLWSKLFNSSELIRQTSKAPFAGRSFSAMVLLPRFTALYLMLWGSRTLLVVYKRLFLASKRERVYHL